MSCSLFCCRHGCSAFLTQVGRTPHTPVAMTTDWEGPSGSYCCQGRICQSKKLAEEGRSSPEAPARLVCGRKITRGCFVCVLCIVALFNITVAALPPSRVLVSYLRGGNLPGFLKHCMSLRSQKLAQGALPSATRKLNLPCPWFPWDVGLLAPAVFLTEQERIC